MNEATAGVLILAGGTGGHIFPGLAVAEALRRREVPVRWLGARGAMESEQVPAAGIEFDAVDIAALRGKGCWRWIAGPFELVGAVRQARRVLARHRPACAVSFGGYAAGPGGIAARMLGVPLLVHEQNRVPGLTNRVLALFASQVLEAFPQSWRKRGGVRTCGNPVRAGVAALPPPAERWAGRSGPIRLLVTGGSQGARSLNRAVPKAIAALPRTLRPEILHQAGRAELGVTREAYRAAGVEAKVEAFIDDMAAAYSWADLVVCRAGALTVSELAAAGLGAILVPFPHAVDDHQARNAQFLAENGAARMLRESERLTADLSDIFTELLADRARLLQMAEIARAQAMPDAADRVAALCQEYLKA